MRLEKETEIEEEKHDLGTFKMLDVSEEDTSEIINPESIDGTSELDDEFIIFEDKTELLSKSAIRIIYSACLVIGLLLAVNLTQSVYEFWNIHWSLGIALLMAAVFLVTVSGRAVYEWVKGKDGLELVHELQSTAKKVKLNGFQTYETKSLLDDLKVYFSDTKHGSRFQSIISEFPDYLTDRERLEQFEERFLLPIDKEVEMIIQRYSIQTAVSVSVSPLPSLDAILTLWRNVMMVNEISKIYGVKPTLSNRVRVLGRIGRNVVYSGLSQVAVDLIIDLSKIPMAGKMIGSVTQGVGAGIATARVGIYCATVCRPIKIDDEKNFRTKFLQSLSIILGKKIISARTKAFKYD